MDRYEYHDYRDGTWEPVLCGDVEPRPETLAYGPAGPGGKAYYAAEAENRLLVTFVLDPTAPR